MDALICTRFSDEKQRGNTSTGVQLLACNAYCERVGDKVVGTKVIEAESAGASNTKRVIELLDFCKQYKGKAQCLVLYKLDRLARDEATHFFLKTELLKLGITLKSATEPIDASPAGQFMETVLSGVAAFENRVKRERVIAAMDNLLTRGIWPWKASLGYINTKSPEGKAGISLIDPSSADDVRELFRLFATGNYTQTELIEVMNQRQVIDHKGRKHQFHDMKINRILRDKFYAGTLHVENWNKDYQGAHEPLVDLRTFKKCQELLNPNRSVVHLVINDQFPVRDKLYCGLCHERMMAAVCKGGNGQGYSFYYCHNKNCSAPKKSISKGDFEIEFYNHLALIRPTEGKLNRFMERLTLRYQVRKSEFESKTTKVTQRLEILEKDKQAVIDMGRKGLLDDEDFRIQLAKVKAEIAEAHGTIQESMGQEFKFEYLVEYSSNFLRNMHLAWNEADTSGKVKIQRLLFPEGIVYSYPGFYETPLSPLFGLFEDKILTVNYAHASPLPFGERF